MAKNSANGFLNENEPKENVLRLVISSGNVHLFVTGVANCRPLSWCMENQSYGGVHRRGVSDDEAKSRLVMHYIKRIILSTDESRIFRRPTILLRWAIQRDLLCNFDVLIFFFCGRDIELSDENEAVFCNLPSLSSLYPTVSLVFSFRPLARED